MFLTDGVAWDGIQLPSLKQLKVRLRSGLLFSSFPCNICRERHPSRGWSPPPRAVGRITLWTQIPHFTDYKGTKLHVFYLGNIFQAEKEEVPGAQGQPHHTVSNLEEPPWKSISARVMCLLPSFPTKSILRDFIVQVGHSADCCTGALWGKAASSAGFISYIRLDFFYVCQALLEPGWAFSGRTFGTDRESK